MKLNDQEVYDYVVKRMIGTTFITSDMYDHPKVSNEIINKNHNEYEADIKVELHYVDIRELPIIKYKYSKYNASNAIKNLPSYDKELREIDYEEYRLSELFD